MTDILDAGTQPEEMEATGNPGEIGQGQAQEGAKVENPSALLSDADPDVKVTAPTDWPEDWRQRMAGGNEDLAKRLSRYNSPANIAKALVDAQTRLRNGVPKPDPDDAKAMAEWRKANGIPEKPEDYKVPEIAGYKWSDADKPIAAKFLETAHEAGLSQAQAEKALGWYASFQMEAQAAQFEADKLAFNTAQQDLLNEWGAGYRGEVKLARDYLGAIPELGTKITEARLADGTRLGDNPAFIRWAAQQGRLTFGDAAFVSNDGQSTISSRKAEIEKIMSENPDEYYSKGLDKEYGKILDAESKIRR